MSLLPRAPDHCVDRVEQSVRLRFRKLHNGLMMARSTFRLVLHAQLFILVSNRDAEKFLRIQIVVRVVTRASTRSFGS